MRSEWKQTSIGDLYDVSSGLSKGASEFGFGYPFLSFKVVFNNYYIPETIHDLANSTETERSKCSIKKGDVFLTRTSETADELGMSCVALKDYPQATFNGFTKRLRPKDLSIEPLYAVYYFRSPLFRRYVDGMATLTTRASLNNGMIRSIPMFYPNVDTQRRIGLTLKAIDDKIACNNAINDNLEKQARLLFQAWFIYYEPFGGIAPSDWYETTLGNIAKIRTESWSPVKHPNDFVEHYSIPAYDECKYPVFEEAPEIKSNKYILTSDSVMISKLNPDTKRIWRPLCLSDLSVCSTEFIVYEGIKREHKDFIYSILDSDCFQQYLCAHTTGSTNSRQRATPSSTLDYPIMRPTDALIESFCSIVTPIYDAISSNIIENQALAKLRDSLLPKLMSGEIDVSSIQL